MRALRVVLKFGSLAALALLLVLGGLHSWVGARARLTPPSIANPQGEATRPSASLRRFGGSYALSIGLVNGTLFDNVVAFSPGFVVPGARAGRPDVYVSHGRQDGVLPIESTSRRIVPALRIVGYHVDYREFSGGHEVPTTVADAVFRKIL